ILWLGLDNGRLAPSLSSSLLLPAARPVGVFAILPIAVYTLTHILPKSIRTHRLNQSHAGIYKKTFGFSFAQACLLLSAIPIGWGAYLLLMWHWTGNAFEGFAAQANWTGYHALPYGEVHPVRYLLDLASF